MSGSLAEFLQPKNAWKREGESFVPVNRHYAFRSDDFPGRLRDSGEGLKIKGIGVSLVAHKRPDASLSNEPFGIRITIGSLNFNKGRPGGRSRLPSTATGVPANEGLPQMPLVQSAEGSLNENIAIAPGSYSSASLPPLTTEVEEMLAEVKEEAYRNEHNGSGTRHTQTTMLHESDTKAKASVRKSTSIRQVLDDMSK